MSLGQIASAMSVIPVKGKLTQERWDQLNDRMRASLLIAPVQPPIEVDFVDLSLCVIVNNPPTFFGKRAEQAHGNNPPDSRESDRASTSDSDGKSSADGARGHGMYQRRRGMAPTTAPSRAHGARLGEGVRLDKPGVRGITLSQLRALGMHVTRRCRKEGCARRRPAHAP